MVSDWEQEAGGGRTLIFPVSALDFLVDILLDVPLEDACAGRLVEASGLEDVCRINPVVFSPAHDMFLEVGAKLVLVHGDLEGVVSSHSGRESLSTMTLTPLYVALYMPALGWSAAILTARLGAPPTEDGGGCGGQLCGRVLVGGQDEVVGGKWESRQEVGRSWIVGSVHSLRVVEGEGEGGVAGGVVCDVWCVVCRRCKGYNGGGWIHKRSTRLRGTEMEPGSNGLGQMGWSREKDAVLRARRGERKRDAIDANPNLKWLPFPARDREQGFTSPGRVRVEGPEKCSFTTHVY